MGCFTIPLYSSVKSCGFEPQRAKQHYRTEGYRECLLFRGVSHGSYRKVSDDFNHTVRQFPSDGVKATSLQYEAKSEAKAIENVRNKKVKEILRTHGFNEQGVPLSELSDGVSSYSVDKKTLDTAYAEVLSEAPSDIQDQLIVEVSDYEDKTKTTYIGIDDVCNKRQKSNRVKGSSVEVEKAKLIRADHARSGGKKKYKKRRFLFHNVTKIINDKGNYTLTGRGISFVWASLMAVLMDNCLLNTNWCFLVDGQVVLYDFIIKKMKWRPFKLLLDWYHLRKKIHSQFYKALKKCDQRDGIMLKVEQYLWYGLIDSGIQLLGQIPQEIIKNQEEIERLIGYFERNRTLIPNYACRKKLGLICSSNRVEKENDLIVSIRQKRNGMSWTREGSDALATLNTVQRNKELEEWLSDGTISLKLAA